MLVDIIVWTLFSWSPWRCWPSARCGGRGPTVPSRQYWRWVGRYQPAVLASVALRTGGQVDTLTWQQDGLSVKVEGAHVWLGSH
jgi:hypothetical protein